MREWEDWLVVILFSVRTRTHTHSLVFLQDFGAGRICCKNKVTQKRSTRTHTWTNMHIIYMYNTLFYIYL